MIQETPSTSNVQKLQAEDIALAPPATPVPDFGESPKTPIGSLLERSMLVIFVFFLHFVNRVDICAQAVVS
jgi:hypothetical protein